VEARLWLRTFLMKSSGNTAAIVRAFGLPVLLEESLPKIAARFATGRAHAAIFVIFAR
jgi:hypothetical protein